MSVTSQIRSMKTKLRSLRNESCSACRTERKKTLRRGDRGRDVAEHVDLGPPRALRPVAEAQRHAAGLERGAHRAAHVDDAARARARAARGRGSRAAASAARPRGGPRRGPGSGWSAARGRARRAAARAAACRCARSAPARARGAGGARTGGRCSRSSAGASPSSRPAAAPAGRALRRIRCTSTPITPEPSPWRPKAVDREPGEVAHLAVVALGDRLADRLAQLVEVEPVAALEALVLADPALERLGLGGAEEERSKSSSKTRRSSCDLASVAASASRKSSLRRSSGTSLERREGVEDLGGADRDALARAAPRRRRAAAPRSVLSGQLAGCSRGVGLPAAGRAPSPVELHRRPARRPGRCRCGA